MIGRIVLPGRLRRGLHQHLAIAPFVVGVDLGLGAAIAKLVCPDHWHGWVAPGEAVVGWRCPRPPHKRLGNGLAVSLGFGLLVKPRASARDKVGAARVG